MISDPHHAEALIRDGQADLVALARELQFDRHRALRAAAVLGAQTASAPHYARAYGFRFLREKEQAWARPITSPPRAAPA